MTCTRCQGLMLLDYWSTDDGQSGVDWRCMLCSARVPVTWRVEYDPPRPIPKKAKYAPEAPGDEFVLTRAGTFYQRATGV